MTRWVRRAGETTPTTACFLFNKWQRTGWEHRGGPTGLQLQEPCPLGRVGNIGTTQQTAFSFCVHRWHQRERSTRTTRQQSSVLQCPVCVSVGEVCGNESSVSVEQCTINRAPQGKIEPFRGQGGCPSTETHTLTRPHTSETGGGPRPLELHRKNFFLKAPKIIITMISNKNKHLFTL